MKKIILLFLSTLWLSACSNDASTDIPSIDEVQSNAPTFSFSENDVVKGHMRIKLKEEPSGQIAVRNVGGRVSTGIRALDGSATLLGVSRMERTFPYAGRYEERTRREGLHLWYDVWYSDEMATTRAISEVAVLDGIDIADPVRKIKLRTTSVTSALVESLIQASFQEVELPWNDPQLSKQWNFYNPGTESWQVKGADIRLSEVWKQYNGDPNIIVAVVDEGIDLNHPDLKANLWTNQGEIDHNGIDDDGNNYVDDIHGYNFAVNSSIITPYKHGTHVAGIIGATNHNGTGVSGIAGGNGAPDSGVKIMCCQILDTRTNDTNSPAAIKYAADNGAVICQNSWGYTGNIQAADKEAIDYFIKYAGCDNDGNQLSNSPMKGGVVLFATNNNDRSDPSDATPADYEKVIGVAAIGPDYKKGTYSNYGDYIDICAPGGKYVFPDETSIYSTISGNNYGYMSGASMACPHVSGVAALIIEKYAAGKRGFTADQLEEILLSTTYDVDVYNPKYAGQLGRGCVNASGALQVELPSDEPFQLKTNPVTDGILSFRVNSQLAGSAIITIYNGTGNRVFRKNIKTTRYNTVSLDISKIAAGYYILEYECSGNKIKEKFAKY